MVSEEQEEIKLLSLFCGYGTDNFAIKRLNIPYKLVGYSDIDKYANQCFKQNHCPEDINDKLRLGDCTKINPYDLEDFDLLTGGFPCQSFSVAGKGLGELDTRGTLFNEIIRIAEVKQPRYMLLENVKGLTTKRHKETFEKILSELDRIGYYVKWKILNTKDYGIPQNRERIWFACFEDFLDYNHFDFPEKEELKIFLKDILEDEVNEKYYLKQEQVDKLLLRAKNNKEKGLGFSSEFLPQDKICQTIQSRDCKEPKIIQLNNPKHSTNRVYSPYGIGRCLRGSAGGLGAKTGAYLMPSSRIRKLTPKECFRLQGFLNDEVKLDGLSNTQQYKLAGNGQSVNVVEKIFKQMFH